MKKFKTYDELTKNLISAAKNGNEEETQAVLAELHESMVEDVKADLDAIIESNDSAILAQRGHRQLTSAENSWYKKLIGAMKEKNPKDAVFKVITEEAMPQTIIEDVYSELEQEHPLLAEIDFNYVGYITHWIMNDHTAKPAVWGKITAAITEEITSALSVIELKQAKLTAFAIIEKGMIDLGPAFIDKYIRTILKEAVADGLEEAILLGTGVDMPVGMSKDIHKGVNFNSESGYPDKKAIAVKTLGITEYNTLVAKLTKSENGKNRNVPRVNLVCNQNDFLTKIAPATTVLTQTGYLRDQFPYATKTIIADCLPNNKAIMFVPGSYFLGLGNEKDAVIEYDDSVKFLEDQRVFKIKQYANGRASDNTVAVVLDITNLEPALLEVKTVADTPTV